MNTKSAPSRDVEGALLSEMEERTWKSRMSYVLPIAMAFDSG